MKKIKFILPIIFLFVILMPVLVKADPIIPCGGPGQNQCGYNDLLKLVNNIIDWIILISIPVATGVFAWAGIKYMLTGVADEKTATKAMLWKVFWGFAAILSAWIIVTTITKVLLSNGSDNGGVNFQQSVPIQGAQ